MTYRFVEYAIPFVRPIRIGSHLEPVRRGFFIQGTDARGNSGWGEIAPLDGYGPDTLDEIKQIITISSIALPEPSGLPPSFRFGLDCAKRELAAKQQGIAFRDTFGSQKRSQIWSATLVQPSESSAGINQKPKFIKVKVGSGPLDNDVSRISRLVAEMPSDGAIRLDANGLWTQEEAQKFATRLADQTGEQLKKIEFIEEPWRGCFSQKLEYPLPMAIDESFSIQDDSWKNASVVMIKPSLFGTVDELLSTKQRIEAENKRLVLSSAFESPLGMSALVALASSFAPQTELGRTEEFAEGFGTLSNLNLSLFLNTEEEKKWDWMKEEVINVNQLSRYPGDALDPDAFSVISGKTQ